MSNSRPGEEHERHGFPQLEFLENTGFLLVLNSDLSPQKNSAPPPPVNKFMTGRGRWERHTPGVYLAPFSCLRARRPEPKLNMDPPDSPHSLGH